MLNAVIVSGKESRSPRTLDEFVIIAGAGKALQRLRDAGFMLIVASNQPEVSRGLQRLSTIARMHEVLRSLLPVDDIRVCYHDDGDGCACRKPEPGLLIDAARDWGVSLPDSYMVGDRWKDIEAGRRAGCKGVLISRPYDQGVPGEADCVAETIGAAAEWILQDSHLSRTTACPGPGTPPA